MYNMEKDKLSRRHHKNPSFSSSLLDEIYRSIDGYDQRREDFKLPKLETRKQSSSANIGLKPKGVANIYNKKKSVEDETEIASFRRACLIEKWMEKKVKDKARRGPSSELDSINYDSLFFSSTSSESNSGTLSASSSEPDSFYSEKSSSSSTTCFAASRTRSIRRASVSPRRDTKLYSFDNQQANKNEESKSKSTALKMYNNLKKVKQPISPGGRLTNFLTSIFNNKSKNLKDANGGNRGHFHEVDERNSKSSSICSSFSRSCLSKTPPKFSQTSVKRTVRFNPVSVIVDEDCRPCGHKSIYDHDSDNLRRPKSQGNAEKNRKFEVDSYKNDYIVDYADEDDDDAASCSSSDLFEIDHLAFFGNKRFCDELPVYETTYVDTNRGIASGFIH
ncbi:protein BIG GRAIN 1-like A [Solanum stenotomum]|uniref:protein BIG GRAIN 1-like A n=1 Tax=Solanum stenotomum TaxID=172797 RepID=UPI0020D0825C|nr:protein BIG GRAIN 1-like A [Solanum stenotomum]